MSAYSADHKTDRLLQLSDEMRRMAGSLASLSTEEHAHSLAGAGIVEDMQAISPDTVLAVIRTRRLRERFFRPDLFADPAWDILLDLFYSELAQYRVAVSSACAAAAVPATTGLRWIKTLVDEGMVIRRADPHDGRRIFLELSPGASEAMRRFFNAAARPSSI
jgi:DNA-binding MarR family transcriptional regulator